MCKLGRDTEDLELQFSAAVAKVMIVVICANSEKTPRVSSINSVLLWPR